MSDVRSVMIREAIFMKTRRFLMMDTNIIMKAQFLYMKSLHN